MHLMLLVGNYVIILFDILSSYMWPMNQNEYSTTQLHSLTALLHRCQPISTASIVYIKQLSVMYHCPRLSTVLSIWVVRDSGPAVAYESSKYPILTQC